MEAESDWFGDVLKVALGIFLGGLLLWAAYEYRQRYLEQQALAELEAATRQVNAEFDAQYEAAVSSRARVQADRDHRLREQRKVASQRAAAERRKEAAWRQFYQPSADCLALASVECGNAYIRARREFEQQYRGGE